MSKLLLLKSSLEFVPVYGWKKRSIYEACVKLGLPTVSSGIKEADLIEFYCRSVEGRLTFEDADKNDLFANAESVLKARGKILKPDVKIWRSALEEMSKPSYMAFAVRNLAACADNVCKLAGDRSFNDLYYYRRALIGSVISSSDIFMVNDLNAGTSSLDGFIARQISRARKIEETGMVIDEAAKTFISSLRRLL
jgi:rpsU-divergently transcribed protein